MWLEVALSYDAVKIFMPAGAEEPVIVHYTEHCPPDVGAAFIWLKNRDPKRWRDVQRPTVPITKRSAGTAEGAERRGLPIARRNSLSTHTVSCGVRSIRRLMTR